MKSEEVQSSSEKPHVTTKATLLPGTQNILCQAQSPRNEETLAGWKLDKYNWTMSSEVCCGWQMELQALSAASEQGQNIQGRCSLKAGEDPYW